jgi:hypothetical protein
MAAVPPAVPPPWSSAVCALGLDVDALTGLQEAAERIVTLGAEVALVRAANGELLAAAERAGGADHPADAPVVLARRMGLVELGVLTRRELDLDVLHQVAWSIERIVMSAGA